MVDVHPGSLQFLTENVTSQGGAPRWNIPPMSLIERGEDLWVALIEGSMGGIDRAW